MKDGAARFVTWKRSMETASAIPATEVKNRSHPNVVLALILAGYLMIVLDIAIVITALPEMHTTLGFTDTGLSWVQNAYLLTFGGLLLLGARSGDILGRRRMFVIGIALFTLASLTAGTVMLAFALVIVIVLIVLPRTMQGDVQVSEVKGV